MKLYVVIDTNVFVSALITTNLDSPTLKVMRAVLDKTVIPLYHPEIMSEYEEVLHRKKFNLKDETIHFVLESIKQFGVEVYPKNSFKTFKDMDDLIFYEVALEMQDCSAYLVTGNIKHFPNDDFIVTPSKMIEIISNWKDFD